MLAMQRLSDPQLSPDGKWLAFVVRTTDMQANKGKFDVWLTSADGKQTRAITTHPSADTHPRWSRDGKSIFFLSTRSGSQQLWQIAIDGGEAAQLSNFALDIGGFAVAGDNKFIVSMEVYPKSTIDETAKRDAERDANPVKARVYEELMFRHWDHWEDGKRSHIFAWTVGAPPVDLMRSMDADSPTQPFGGFEEVAVSPGGEMVVFA